MMNKRAITTMSRTEWTMLLTLSILWGGSFFFVEVAIQSLPVLSVVTLRVALAARGNYGNDLHCLWPSDNGWKITGVDSQNRD